MEPVDTPLRAPRRRQAAACGAFQRRPEIPFLADVPGWCSVARLRRGVVVHRAHPLATAVGALWGHSDPCKLRPSDYWRVYRPHLHGHRGGAWRFSCGRSRRRLAALGPRASPFVVGPDQRPKMNTDRNVCATRAEELAQTFPFALEVLLSSMDIARFQQDLYADRHPVAAVP